MLTFSFLHDGRTLEVRALTALAAMVVANRHFNVGAGAWLNAGEGKYRWTAGNFFD